jgi:hypothetical protein
VARIEFAQLRAQPSEPLLTLLDDAAVIGCVPLLAFQEPARLLDRTQVGVDVGGQPGDAILLVPLGRVLLRLAA